MVVVAIIGLVLAMGVPSLQMALNKEGMRKGVSDVLDACSEARARAIFQGKTTEIVFYPQDNRWAITDASSSEDQMAADNSSDDNHSAPVPAEHSPWSGAASGALPNGVVFAMMDINFEDYLESPDARVRFFPNGTCDEMTLVLHSRDEWEKITLEFATALATASEVKK